MRVKRVFPYSANTERVGRFVRVEIVPPNIGRIARFGASSSRCLMKKEVLRKVEDQNGEVVLSFSPVL